MKNEEDEEMSQSLEDLVGELSSVDHDEQMQRIRKIRKKKYEEKPAAQQHKKKAETKRRTDRKTKVEKMLEGMSEEERAALLKSLEQEEDVDEQD